MSLKSYSPNPNPIIIVECTWTSNGERITYRGVQYTASEESALEFARQTVLGASYPDFTMKIVEKRDC